MEKIIGEWKFQSWTSEDFYTVRREGSKWSCTCYYFQNKKKQCKHITQKKQDLGLIKPDLSHYKSGIQKAIRRGDLSLLKKCFSKLWEEDRSWLMWRLPVLAVEENWRYGQIAVEIALDKEAKREEVWKLLANLTLKPKNKEAEGIAELLSLYKKKEFNAEKYMEEAKLRMFKEILRLKENERLWKEDKEKYWGLYSQPLNEVGQSFFNAMKRRINYGPLCLW